jgi:hypothetical protein
MEQGFLFASDQEKQIRDKERERRSRIFGTPEFWFACAKYIKSPEWRKLCRLVKGHANNRCEKCPADQTRVGRLTVHHLTYERFMCEKLTDLQLLCDHHHDLADLERERRSREAYEVAGEETMDAAGMNTYFTKKLGHNWADYFGSDIAAAYEEWDGWKERKAEEEGYDYY